MGCFEYTQMIFYWCAFDQKEQKVMGKGQMMRKRQQIKQKDKKTRLLFTTGTLLRATIFQNKPWNA